MNLKNLIADDDAVSPVIGVILMVAITVILAAVIGTFVLGLGENLQNTGPTASITFDQSDIAGNDAKVKISHGGGDKLNADSIDIQAPDNPGDSAVNSWADGDGEITAGETITLDNGGSGYSSGAEIKVIWTSDGGGNSAVLGEHEVQ